MSDFVGRFRSRDIVPFSKAALPPEENDESDEDRESSRFRGQEMSAIIDQLRIRMADGARVAMQRFKAASARRRGVGDAKRRQRTADEATLQNPKATSMERMQAASRLQRSK